MYDFTGGSIGKLKSKDTQFENFDGETPFVLNHTRRVPGGIAGVYSRCSYLKDEGQPPDHLDQLVAR